LGEVIYFILFTSNQLFFFIFFFFLLKGIEFLILINKRILLGGKPGDPDVLTNDEMFDVLDTPKTIKKGIFYLLFLYV
jgi:hypothetical protein